MDVKVITHSTMKKKNRKLYIIADCFILFFSEEKKQKNPEWFKNKSFESNSPYFFLSKFDQFCLIVTYS